MQIENDIKLDFNDVLIKPKRSQAISRADVDLNRSFRFLNCDKNFNNPVNVGVPIIAANMDTIGTMEMARALANYGCHTALHKFYSVSELEKFFKEEDSKIVEKVFYTTGTSDADYEKLRILQTRKVDLPKICIDVANGYTQSFVEKCKELRDWFPASIIMAGNVCTPEQVLELLLVGKVSICKVGIGGGCFVAGTKVKTKDGFKSIEKVKVGDEVYTHTGSIKKVASTMSRKESNTIISVNGINCTPNHEFYVIEKKHKGIIADDNIHLYAKWVSAEELNDNYFLVKLANNC